MPDTHTRFDGIIIRTRETDSKSFVQKVIAALETIYSKPVGKKLLNEIVARVGKQKFGYTVCIMPQTSVKQSFGLIRWRKYEKGSVTITGSDSDASTPGVGAVSCIRWDPVHYNTPDGSRPPFIGLAHELIHCYHNLRGTSTLVRGEEGKKEDEMRVVGLRGYENEPISENLIRREHQLPYRTSYYQRCSAQDGAPDVQLLKERYSMNLLDPWNLPNDPVGV